MTVAHNNATTCEKEPCNVPAVKVHMPSTESAQPEPEVPYGRNECRGGRLCYTHDSRSSIQLS